MAASDRGHTVSPAPNSPGPDRLDTWKEIAGHLRRAVRTVQRWEQVEGLPIHRHQHDKQGSIYAFKSEIDAWWAARSAVLADDVDQTVDASEKAPLPAPPVPTVPETSPPRRRSSTRFALAGAAATIIVAAGALLLWRSLAPSRASSRHEPHRFLIADFENLTDEPTL